MTLLAQAASFALGVYVSLRLVAALYRVVDLWYALPRAWPAVAGPIAAWTGITAALVLVLPPPLPSAFTRGLAAFAAFYLLLYVVREPLFRVALARVRRAR